MDAQVVSCPHCGKEFPLADAVSRHLKEEIEADIRKKVQQENAILIDDIKEQYNANLADVEARLTSEKQKREEAEKAEKALRSDREAFEDQKRNWELQKERELDAERKNIRQKALTEADEKHDLERREKEELINGLKKQIDNLNQKITQGSQQMQGEVQELVLEDFLKEKFPFDEFVPVATGKAGADILQRVRNEWGYTCGAILWESKRTKNWNNSWYAKLNEDRQVAKADFGILVSRVLPEGVKDFDHLNGVWITCTSRSVIAGLATTLRLSIFEIANERSRTQNRGSKIDDLYNYVTSPDFRERVIAVVGYFNDMKKELEEEKQQTILRWAKRETQIEKVTEKTIEIRGVLEASIGNPMVRIDSLGLTQLTVGATPSVEHVEFVTDAPVD